MPGQSHSRDPDEAARLSEWHLYYSRKRVPHQNRQIELLAKTPARRVLEIGPHLGYVTALLDNAGYEVETMDIHPRGFARPDVRHHLADLTRPDAPMPPGFDAVICCETLEHVPWEAAGAALKRFGETGARHLILSVPWAGFHFALATEAAPTWVKTRLHLKWPNSWRRFRPWDEPFGHQWELGYRGRTVRAWEGLIAAGGWRVRERHYTHPTQSVMHLCERAD